MRRKTRLVLAATFSVVLAVSQLTIARTAMAASMKPSDAAGSIEYLTRTYGVSVQEAQRRLELQNAMGPLRDTLARDNGGVYAGSWIDQKHGGELVIAATEAGALAPALSRVPQLGHVRFVKAKHSLDDLVATAARAGAELKLPSGQEPVINEQKNRVELHNAAAEAVRASGERQSRAAKLGVTVVTDPGTTPYACTITACDAPMRGGLQLDLWTSDAQTFKGNCTNGFGVKGSNGWVYALTAGHCFSGSIYVSSHHGTYVSSFTTPTWIGATYPTDGYIAPYATVNGWEASKYWAVSPRNTVYNSRSSAQYSITGSWTYEQIALGWIACRTGATSNNTTCGEITGKNGGLVTNIFSCQGDSGGPLFSESDHKAYGILQGGQGVPCSGTVSFSPLSKILAAASAKYNITYSLITSP